MGEVLRSIFLQQAVQTALGLCLGYLTDASDFQGREDYDIAICRSGATLMMQIMKNRPIPINRPRHIPRKHIPAMIANRLDGRARPKHHTLPRAQLRHFARNHKGDDIQEQGFEPVGVDGALGVGDVEAVVLRVHEAVERAVCVAEAVGEVDPGVNDDEGEGVLGCWGEVIEGEFCEGEFEGCWGIVRDS